jgi:hypothetical protein
MSEHRPLGVSLISILLGLNGLVSVVYGILLLFHVGEDLARESLGVSDGDITVFAISAIAVGVITLIIAGALRSGSNVARMVLAVLWFAQVGLLIWSMIQLHNVHWSSNMWPVVVSGLAAGYLLFDNDAKAFFRSA